VVPSTLATGERPHPRLVVRPMPVAEALRAGRAGGPGDSAAQQRETGLPTLQWA
jgi:hypothetical protein